MNGQKKKDAIRCQGRTICEVLIVLMIVAMSAAIALPVLASTSGGMGIAGSKRNLMQLHMAHQLYAADYNGNQWVNVAHDLASFGDTANEAVTHWIQSIGGNSHPHVGNNQWQTFIGWAVNPSTGSLGMWRFQYNGYLFPMGFDSTLAGGVPTVPGFGYFRMFQSRGFNPYVNGKYHDETFIAPRHAVALAAIGDCMHGQYDYCVTDPVNQALRSSYSLSPAALYHPDFWSVPEGEFPENTDAIFAQFDNAFHALPYDSAKYPDLKTHMSEDVWLQNRTAGPCIPGDVPSGPAGWGYAGCVSWFFNASIHSAPVTLFYDGHVRLLPLTEVKAADDQIGVWRRDTPLGEDGYFHQYGSPGDDNPELSHHILTNGGILGRDTLGQ